MAQKVVIDVEARFVDNLTDDIKKVDKSLDGLEKRKPKVTVDADASDANGEIDKTGKKLDELGKKHPKPTIDAEDNASKKILGILDKAKSLADKVYEVAVKIRDNDVLAELSKMEQKARGLAGKVWTATVKIKDMALAPLQKIRQQLFSIKTLAAGIIGGVAANKFVVQPTKAYADYEDLVTQFAVLLKGDSSKPNYSAAQSRIEELTSFAGQTPFTRDEIYQASRVLQTYTQGALATPDATGGLRMIGDIAAATGAEYSQVATYMGRLYNEVKRGGESLGEPLAFLREMGALSAEQEQKIKDIAIGSGAIEDKWKKIADQFSSVDGMMMEMSNQTNNLLLGVQSFIKNNLYKKLGEGISQSLKPFLIDFRKWRSDNADLISSWAEQIKDFAAMASDKVLSIISKTARRANRIMQSDEFKNADLFGKIGMLWEGAIKNPFAEWWKGTVQPWWDDTAAPWLAEKAAKLGTIIGTGLSNGLLALLGVDVSGVAGEGASIAGSFVQGFMDGFDGSAITEALVDAIGNVWNALPAWAKLLVGGIGVAKGASMISSIAGGLATAAGGVSSFLGGAAAGTGILGAGANAAIGLGAGNLAGGAALGAGALSLLGLGSIAGGAIGLGTAASGVYDMYKGRKEGDSTRTAAGFTKAGGVAAGAATGALIGSVVPVLGTAAGALIGAGVGGIAGIMGSNRIKKKAAENAESLKELETQMDSNSQAADVYAKKQDALAKALGDVKLSYAEIKDVAANILTGDMAESMQTYTTATVNANKALQTFEQTTEDLNKLNWKASVGFKFDEEGKETYKKAVEDYITSAECVIENEHYEFTAAVSMLLDPKSEAGANIIAGGDAFYKKMQEELDGLSAELKKEVDVAFETGDFSGMEKIQQEISEKMQQLTSAEIDAKMETLKIKFGAGAISADTFSQLQEELSAQLESSEIQLTDALTASITSLKLQYPEGGAAYEEAKAQLEEGFKQNMKDLHVKATDLQLEVLGDAFNIDPTQLQTALKDSIDAGIQPMNWTAAQANKFLNTTGLTAEMATGIGTALQSVSEFLPPVSLDNVQVTGGENIGPIARSQAEGGMTSAFANPFSPTAIIEATATGMETTGPKVREGTETSIHSSLAGTIAATAHVSVTPAISVVTAGIKAKVNSAVQAALGGAGTVGGGGGGKKGGFRGGLFGPTGIRQFSDGGMVRGGAQLITVAEEGSPEMIIPMSSQRRGRALKLWAQAGHMMGVPGFARGGLVGGQEDEGLRYQNAGRGSASGGQGINVNVGGVTVQVNVDGGGDNPDIAAAIANQGDAIAEQVAGILADAFKGQFENTPTKGVA